MKILRIAPLILIFFLPGCAKKPEEDPNKAAEAANKPRLVGRVASIPADRKFVLIQSYGIWHVGTGSILTTQGPQGRASNLLVTGEKLGQYAAADIQSGTLEIGDGVYTVGKIPERLETPSDANPEETQDEPKPDETVPATERAE